MNYLDFDIAIQRVGDSYRAHVLDSPGGEATVNFSWPFDKRDLEIFLLRMGHERRSVRGINSPEAQAAKTFGGQLFTSIFSGGVQTCLRSSLEEAENQGKGLRIRLRLNEAPELVNIPWEYLYNPSVNTFLVLSQATPLVRFLEMTERIRPLEVSAPLRILVMIASPTDYPRLDVDQEWTNLREALKDLEQNKQVVLERLEEATLAALTKRIGRSKNSPELAYHVFHFIGHGGFEQGGLLIMEDAFKRSQKVSSEHLATILQDARSLRLAVLNSCEGARTTLDDPFAGTAQRLVQQRIPAVIAMQFEITDTAAITFSHEFYQGIANDLPVDAALAEARRMIYSQGNGLEWGTPVLYMRSPDGRIFDVKQPVVPPPPPPESFVQKSVKSIQSVNPPVGAPPVAAAPASVVQSNPPTNGTLAGPNPPPSELPELESPDGIVDAGSPFYIEREEDQMALGEILSGQSVIIKAPGQMGRSSLLERLIGAAEDAGRIVVRINFQNFSQDALTNGELFFKKFCSTITYKLKEYQIDNEVDSGLSNAELGQEYLRLCVLPKLPKPLFLAMDEVDCFFNTSFRSDFYTTLRVLRNERAIYPILKRLNFALVTSADPIQLIDHGSPMNLVRVVWLRDFNEQEVDTLNRLHGGPLDPPKAREKLMSLTGGHPYLVRRALYKLAKKMITLDDLFAQAASENGPFGTHLKYLYHSRLLDKEDDKKGLREVLAKNTCQDERVALRLTSAGIVYSEGKKKVMRCELYRSYFEERLNAEK